MLEGWRTLYQPDSLQLHDRIAEALAPRDRGILESIAEGHSNKEIARTLAFAPETVKWYLKNIFKKLSVEAHAQAIARAQSLGLLRTVVP